MSWIGDGAAGRLPHSRPIQPRRTDTEEMPVPERPAFLAGLDPDATLQVFPEFLVLMHRSRSGAQAADYAKSPPSKPSGPLLAVLVTTGKRSGRVDVGGWTFDMERNQEQIASLVGPAELARESALELWIYPLEGAEQARVIDVDPSKIVFRAKGSRLTRWGKVRDADDVRADGTRGLRMDVDTDGALIMDWWHVVDDDIFCNVDDDVPAGQPALVTLLSTEQQGPESPIQMGWFQAERTRFDRLDS